MSQSEVEQYRKSKEMTLSGRNVPRPVKNFSEMSFPGMLLIKKFNKCIILPYSCQGPSGFSAAIERHKIKLARDKN